MSVSFVQFLRYLTNNICLYTSDLRCLQQLCVCLRYEGLICTRRLPHTSEDLCFYHIIVETHIMSSYFNIRLLNFNIVCVIHK